MTCQCWWWPLTASAVSWMSGVVKAFQTCQFSLLLNWFLSLVHSEKKFWWWNFCTFCTRHRTLVVSFDFNNFVLQIINFAFSNFCFSVPACLSLSEVFSLSLTCTHARTHTHTHAHTHTHTHTHTQRKWHYIQTIIIKYSDALLFLHGVGGHSKQHIVKITNITSHLRASVNLDSPHLSQMMRQDDPVHNFIATHTYSACTK